MEETSLGLTTTQRKHISTAMSQAMFDNKEYAVWETMIAGVANTAVIPSHWQPPPGAEKDRRLLALVAPPATRWCGLRQRHVSVQTIQLFSDAS